MGNILEKAITTGQIVIREDLNGDMPSVLKMMPGCFKNPCEWMSDIVSLFLVTSMRVFQFSTIKNMLHHKHKINQFQFSLTSHNSFYGIDSIETNQSIWFKIITCHFVAFLLSITHSSSQLEQ